MGGSKTYYNTAPAPVAAAPAPAPDAGQPSEELRRRRIAEQRAEEENTEALGSAVQGATTNVVGGATKRLLGAA